MRTFSLFFSACSVALDSWNSARRTVIYANGESITFQSTFMIFSIKTTQSLENWYWFHVPVFNWNPISSRSFAVFISVRHKRAAEQPSSSRCEESWRFGLLWNSLFLSFFVSHSFVALIRSPSDALSRLLLFPPISFHIVSHWLEVYDIRQLRFMCCMWHFSTHPSTVLSLEIVILGAESIWAA